MSSTSCATSRRTSKAQSFRHVRTCLHKACKDAVRWGRLPKNPVDVADPPSTRGAAKKELKTWHAKQLRGFLKSTKDNRFAHLWRVPAMTGMRRGEAWVERLLRSAIGGLHVLSLVNKGLVCSPAEPNADDVQTGVATGRRRRRPTEGAGGSDSRAAD